MPPLQQPNQEVIPQAYSDKVAPRAPQYVTSLACWPGPVGVQPIISWDLPSYATRGQGISGCNIYRSYGDPFNGYTKVNPFLVTTRVYNDNLTMNLVVEAPVSKAVVTFQGRDFLVIRASRKVFSNLMLCENTEFLIPVMEARNFSGAQKDFLTSVYGEILWRGQRVYPSYVEGDLFYIDCTPTLGDDQALTAYVNGRLEDYQLKYYTTQASPYDLLMESRVYYKVIPVNHLGQEIVSLESSDFCEYNDTQSFGWVWKAALRRNIWLLWFGGESCLVYLRKWSGEQCKCQTGDKSAPYECPLCLGTGILGGYVGPYSIKITFETTMRSRAVNDFGSRNKEETRGIFLPAPYLRTGDVIIRKNGQKMALGEVENISNRGTILQQEFSLGDANCSLKFSLPDNRGVRQFFAIPDHPDQVSQQKGAQPTFSHLQLGPG